MKKRLILLAEDEPDDVVLLKRGFSRINVPYRMEVASDGQQAIDYLNGRGIFVDRDKYPFPSLMLLDMGLPKRSGKEILTWLQETDLPSPLFVITISGASRSTAPPETFEKAGKAWIFHGYFLKPITDYNLKMIVNIFESWRRKQ